MGLTYYRYSAHALNRCDGAVIPVKSEAKCLGYWWQGDLLASKCISKNIGKARHSFFFCGRIGTFQGDLNPSLPNLLLKHVPVQCCSMAVKIGLSGKCYSELESFMGEIAKRALKWPKHFSNTAALVCQPQDATSFKES